RMTLSFAVLRRQPQSTLFPYTTLFRSCGLHQQNGSGSTLGFKSEAAVAVYGDDHGSRQTRLYALGLGVERFAEFHDVDAVLAQSRAYRRTRVSLAGLDLQLDISLNLLCHQFSPLGASALRLPVNVLPTDNKTPHCLQA